MGSRPTSGPTRSSMRWRIRRAATSSPWCCRIRTRSPTWRGAIRSASRPCTSTSERWSARGSSRRRARGASSACAAMSGPCGPRIACWTISKGSGGGASTAWSRSSRIRPRERRNDRDQRRQGRRRQDHEYHRALRRADRPRLAGLERPAPAGALVGAAGVSRHRDGARPRAGRHRGLRHDRAPRRPTPGHVARARGRPAPQAGVRGRLRRRRQPPAPRHADDDGPCRPLRAAGRRHADGDHRDMGQRRGDGAFPRHRHGRRPDRRRRADRRAARPPDASLIARPHERRNEPVKLTTMTQVTVDGVMQGNGAASDEDRRGGFERGGWAMGVFDNETMTLINETYQRADAFLFGRRTYELFAGYWGAGKNPDSPITAALNTKPKYVASTTLSDPQWADTTVLSGDLAAAVGELKAKPGRELQVHGSLALFRWLLANGLVDEMTLLTYPVVVGQGKRLFPDTGRDRALELVESRATPSGVTIQVYRPTGRPRYGEATADMKHLT